MFFSFVSFLFIKLHPKIITKMEDDDRRQILDNIDRLINVTKFETLLKKCQNKGILTSNMSDDIMVNILNISLFIINFTTCCY